MEKLPFFRAAIAGIRKYRTGDRRYNIIISPEVNDFKVCIFLI